MSCDFYQLIVMERKPCRVCVRARARVPNVRASCVCVCVCVYPTFVCVCVSAYARVCTNYALHVHTRQGHSSSSDPSGYFTMAPTVRQPQVEVNRGTRSE